MGIRLDVETIGIPEIFPSDLVSIQGLGDRINAPYLVMKVIHTYTASGFGTSLQLISSTSDFGKKAAKGKKLTVNRQVPDEGNIDTVSMKAKKQKQ
jgi:hypothetical protein